MRLIDLVGGVEPDKALRGLIEDLVAAKSGLDESATYRVPSKLLDYLQTLVESLATFGVPTEPPAPAEAFDALFRKWVTN